MSHNAHFGDYRDNIMVGHWVFSGQLSTVATHFPCLSDILVNCKTWNMEWNGMKRNRMEWNNK